MQCYDISSVLFLKRFPQFTQVNVIEKYQQLLSNLLPDSGVFFLFLDDVGDCCVHSIPSKYRLETPALLLNLLTDGASVLHCNSLAELPYRGIFSNQVVAKIQFFACSAIQIGHGPLMGALGLVSEQYKTFLPDEQVFLQWLAESVAQDLIAGEKQPAISPDQTPSIVSSVLPYLDDIYMMVDSEGVIISVAAQLPGAVKDAINAAGGNLTAVFGKENQIVFNDLIELTQSTSKKQTKVLPIKVAERTQYFSVSCNVFSDGWFLLTFHDVTERNRMRSLLETRTQLLEGIVQCGNVAILLINATGEVLYSNDKANSWFAINTEESPTVLPAPHWHHKLEQRTALSPFQHIFSTAATIKDQHYRFYNAENQERIVSITASLAAKTPDQVSQATFFIKDVTERAKLEEAMHAMDQQMQFLLQSSPVIIYQLMFNPAPVLTYISPNAETILGYSLDSLLASDAGLLALVHPEDLGLVKAKITVSEKQLLEYRLKIAGTNDYCWFKDVRQSIASAEQTNVIGALIDISERKRQEQQLNIAQQRFQELIKHVPGMIYQFQLNPDGTSCFPFVTNGIESFFALTPEQVQHCAKAVFDALHPDDYPHVVLTIEQSANTLQQWLCRFRVNNVKDQSYWLEGVATPTKLANGSILWHGYLRDISEQQSIELKNHALQRELSATLDSLVDAVISIDKKGNICGLNPATTKIFGYAREEMLGKNIAMLMPNAIAREHDGYLKAYQQTGDAKIIGIGREVLAQHKNGHEIPIALAISEVGEGDNKRYVGCCHDLTTFKKQQEQLMHSEKLSAVGKLTSSLAHDFNNILGIIRGYAEMLQQQAGSTANLASPIIDASDRASAMINQLLDFSSAKQRPTQRINVFTHLTQLHPLLRQALNKKINFSITHQQQDVWLEVELPAFDNALLNMVVNANYALKNSSAPHFSIQVTKVIFNATDPQALLPSGEYAKFVLQDNGCGMSEAVKAKIFEPFFTTKGAQGTGLGLAQTYGMLQRCRGHIFVESQEGKGTAFIIYLPVVPALMQTAKPITQNNAFQRPSKEPISSLNITDPRDKQMVNILLVDDEPELLEMHAMLLETAGYRVFKVGSAAAATEVAAKEAIDILLSDIVMPEINGFALAKSLKANYPQLKVQLISGFADKSMILDEECLRWYDERLTKPVAITSLLKRIKQVLSR